MLLMAYAQTYLSDTLSTKWSVKDKDTYVAKSWRPVEASLVSIPADVSVGVGRSSEPSPEPVTVTVRTEETPHDK